MSSSITTTSDLFMLQERYRATLQKIHQLNETLDILQKNDFKRWIMPILRDFQQQIDTLEAKENTLKYQNEALKFEINGFKQLLSIEDNDDIEQEQEQKKDASSANNECELIESKHIKLLKNIDYDSLSLADEKWSNKIFDLLISNNISFTLLKHPAVFTCEQASKYDGNLNGSSCKNLFLQDKKKKFFFILSALETTKFRINELKSKITSQHKEVKCGKLQFGKEQILNSRLSLIKGSVTPFGILNDKNKETILLIDENMTRCKYVKFHPLINTMSISIKLTDFTDLLNKLEYKYYIVKLD